MKSLVSFLNILKQEQRRLIVNCAENQMLPSDKTLQKIADLENSIAAVEALIHEAKAEKAS